MAEQKLRGVKYAGDLYGRKWGTDNEFEELGNVTELTTSKDADSDELLSTGREDHGEALEVDNSSGATQINVKFNTFDKHALARALMGEAVDLDTQIINITDKTVAVTTKGWAKLAEKDIDESTLAFTKEDGTAIDPAVDKYEVNERLGMVRFTELSTLAVGDQLTYSASTKGTSGYQIAANTLTNLPLEMYLDGKNKITDKSGILTMPHGVLTSDGDLNWMSDDWWESGLSGKLVKDDKKETMLFTEYDTPEGA